MQIFTKKGAFNTAHPQIEGKVSAGVVQSQWANTVQQDHSLAVTGGGSDFSYQLGGGYVHYGDWAPEVHSTNASVYGGLRGVQGPVTVELSARYYDKSFANSFNPEFGSYTYFSEPFDQPSDLRQQTYGVTFKYAASPRWQHNLVLGYDRSAFQYYSNRPRFTTPSDSLLSVFSYDATKASVAYNTTVEVPLSPAVHSSVTAGADHYRYLEGGFLTSSATTNINLIASPLYGLRYQYDNTGYFAQGQFAFWEALFLTAGLRADDNQNFGQDFGLAWAPRVGLSYVHAVGGVTAKARMAYGKAIRPPSPGAAVAYITSSFQQLANPNLAPEQQVGSDGGLELYFGTRGSFEVSYYDQTAIDLINAVILPNSSIFTLQYQNVGRIKNTGWEFQGRLNADRFSLAGTYSITSSHVQTLSPSYGGVLRPGDQLLAVPQHTAGATLGYARGRTSINLGMTYVGSWINTDLVAFYAFVYGGQPYRGSIRDYWITYPSFVKLNLSVSEAVTDRLSVFVRSDNFTNNNVSEQDNSFVNSGRVTMVGVRTGF